MIFQLPQYKRGVTVADTVEVFILEDFFLLDSVRYRHDVMPTLKFDWSNLKILMSSCHYHQVDIANWHRYVFHLQYISNAIAKSRVMLLQYRYNIRMSTGKLSNQIKKWILMQSNNLFLTVMIGDLNPKSSNLYLHGMNSFEGSQIGFIASQLTMSQVIKEPTHILDNPKPCKDFIFTSQPNMIMDPGVNCS